MNVPPVVTSARNRSGFSISTLFLIIICIVWMAGCAAPYTKVQMLEPIQQHTTITSHRMAVDDGLNMHYIEAGQGRPLVLIHGWLCSSGFWQKQIPALAETNRVIAVDLIGCGFSDKPLNSDLSYSTGNQARWILSLLDRLGIEQASIVGHSLGGHIATKIALAAPERVDKLILVSAAGFSENPRLLPWYMRIGRSFHLDGLALMFATRTSVTIANRLCMYYPDSPTDDFFLDQLMGTTFACRENRNAAVKLTHEALFHDFCDDRLPDITAPTLLAWGANDKVVPPWLGIRYLNLIPDANLVLIEKSGHLMPLEKPDRLNREILDFLKDKTEAALEAVQSDQEG
ncbi:MAG: alpha/beta hydrolase [Thermodesulfobacteriota bacterium]|nr:alpha/beta hydrolase [Thermodesulfobacteriota bacterium]